MAQGNYDHPSYITRVMDVLGPTTAGANGTSFLLGYPTGMRIRRVSAAVKTAGTSATTGNVIMPMILTGTVTTTLGTMTIGTSTANTIVQLADVNATLPVGSLLFFKNGTDASGVSNLVMETHLDPLLGTWGAP
jgi:hypothetical protein